MMLSATIGTVVLGLTGGCGGGQAQTAQLDGMYDCGSNHYVFTATGWSAPGTPSNNLPYEIRGEYVYMLTLAKQTVPMLKYREGTLYSNTEGLDDGWSSPCTKRS